eukprot:4732971-Prymnesium_polylepis.1
MWSRTAGMTARRRLRPLPRRASATRATTSSRSPSSERGDGAWSSGFAGRRDVLLCGRVCVSVTMGLAPWRRRCGGTIRQLSEGK